MAVFQDLRNIDEKVKTSPGNIDELGKVGYNIFKHGQNGLDDGPDGWKGNAFVRVIQMIMVKTVNLYEEFLLPAPAGAAGSLQVLAWNTPARISPRRRRPGVLVIPGGGYEHVSTREGEPVAMRFAAAGYSAFVLDYTVAPARFPTALREAAMAMAYIRSHADEFEVDPHMVAAVGFSAGGHLCGTLGTLFDGPEVRDLAPPELLRPDALGLCYPVTVSSGPTHAGSWSSLCGEDAALRARLALPELARVDMPPVYLWHTRTDGSVPVRNSLLLAAALDGAGVDFALHIYPTGPHGVSLGDVQSNMVQNLPKISNSILNWPEEMMEFFAERGFAITDGDRSYE